jgi:hypothetical protein
MIMPAMFDSAGIIFAYPDNWSVEEDNDPGSAALVVTALSPDTAFWTVSRYEGYRDVRELANCVLEAMQTEYPQVEIDDIEGDRHGVSTVGYELSFSYLDLNNTAMILTFHHGDSTFLILSQAEDHELPRVEPVFDAMLASLVRAAA